MTSNRTHGPRKQNPGDEIRARSTLYDPVTGLIVTDRHDERLATYDVDRDQWETIPIDLGFQTVKGKRPGDPGGVLLAYHPGLDKIVSWGHPMAIIDLRSGEVQIDSEPLSPSLVSGYAPPLRYAQDSESGRGIIHDFGGGALWAYDPTQPGWELIYGLSEDFETGPGAVGIRIYDAMVYDTINGRLVVIGGRVKIDGEWETIDDVSGRST